MLWSATLPVRVFQTLASFFESFVASDNLTEKMSALQTNWDTRRFVRPAIYSQLFYPESQFFRLQPLTILPFAVHILRETQQDQICHSNEHVLSRLLNCLL